METWRKGWTPRSGGTFQKQYNYAQLRNKSRWIEKRYGMDRRTRPWDQEPEPVVYEEGKLDYTKGELGQLADDFLREDARTELCIECGEKGEKNGTTKPVEQDAKDEAGHALVLEFEQYECSSGHKWFEGEGKVRGIGGDDPILFEEHFQSRRRREIYTSLGTPDPNIVSGIYNRSHPQGRKINSDEQRKKNGASYYR